MDSYAARPYEVVQSIHVSRVFETNFYVLIDKKPKSNVIVVAPKQASIKNTLSPAGPIKPKTADLFAHYSAPPSSKQSPLAPSKAIIVSMLILTATTARTSPRKKASLRDIAQAAGVSTCTDLTSSFFFPPS